MGDAPRYTGLNGIPNVVTPPLSTVSYPATPSNNINGSGFAIAYGLDDHLKTPYSIAADLSIQRELPHGFTVEGAYVGRFGRHQLQQMDRAAPLDLVDKKSGMDYYGAARLLDQAVDQGKTAVAPIPYWENMFPAAAQGGNTATQNIYTYLFQTNRGNEVAIPFYLDVICYVPGLANSPCGSQSQRFWPLQYSSLYVWVSNGNSSYNGAQFMLRHAMSHGLQMDLSYTFSKSIDMGSDAERSSSTGGYTAFSQIIDALIRPRIAARPTSTPATSSLAIGSTNSLSGKEKHSQQTQAAYFRKCLEDGSSLDLFAGPAVFLSVFRTMWVGERTGIFAATWCRPDRLRLIGISMLMDLRRPSRTRGSCRPPSPPASPGGCLMPEKLVPEITSAAMAFLEWILAWERIGRSPKVKL